MTDMSFDDRLTRLEIAGHATENELDRIYNRLENFVGEVRFRLDRLDAGQAALRKDNADLRMDMRDMHSKLDVILTRLGEKGTD